MNPKLLGVLGRLKLTAVTVALFVAVALLGTSAASFSHDKPYHSCVEVAEQRIRPLPRGRIYVNKLGSDEVQIGNASDAIAYSDASYVILSLEQAQYASGQAACRTISCWSLEDMWMGGVAALGLALAIHLLGMWVAWLATGNQP